MGILVLAVTLGVIAVILILHPQQRRLERTERRYAEKIAARDAISFRDFAQRHFPKEDPEVVCEILDCVRQMATVPMDRLDPTDHMIDDLTIGAWDALEPCGLVADIEDRFDRSIGLPQREFPDTLGQFIGLCCRKLKEPDQRVRSDAAGPSDGPR
jgi:hypothetical protein